MRVGLSVSENSAHQSHHAVIETQNKQVMANQTY